MVAHVVFTGTLAQTWSGDPQEFRIDDRTLGEAALRKELKETAARALADRNALPVFKPRTPATLTLRFRDWEELTACEAVPGVQRIGVDTFQCPAATILDAQKCFMTLRRVART